MTVRLTSAFLNKRDITLLTREELEDLDYHLQNRRTGLLQKLELIQRDLADIDEDRKLLVSERSKRPSHA
jgi:hypothetical protein